MRKSLITIENGKKVEYDIVVQFSSNKTNKKYVAYTNNSKNSNNKTIYMAYYEIDPKDKEIYILLPIKDKNEIEMFNQILQELSN